MTFAIFTNDRGTEAGVPMYSCLKLVRASSPEEALEKCPPQWNAPPYAPAKAIRRPLQSDDDKAWLEKHVGVRP